MSADEMWRLADAWYHDRNHPDWSRPTLEVAEALYADIGLVRDFWRLR